MTSAQISTNDLYTILVFGLHHRIDKPYEDNGLRKTFLNRLFLRKVSDELEGRNELTEEAAKRRYRLAMEAALSEGPTIIKNTNPSTDRLTEPVLSAAREQKKEGSEAGHEHSRPKTQSIAHLNSTSSDSVLVKKESSPITRATPSGNVLVGTEATKKTILSVLPPEQNYGHFFTSKTYPFSHEAVERNQKKDITETIPKLSRKRCLSIKKLDSPTSTNSSSSNSLNGSTCDQDNAKQGSNPKPFPFSQETNSKRRCHSGAEKSSKTALE